MAIHVDCWTGSRSFRVTDMTNAGKRGKKCRTLHFSGVCWDEFSVKCSPVQLAAVKLSREGLILAQDAFAERPEMSFEEAAGMVGVLAERVRAEGVPPGYVQVRQDEIRGIDASKPKLTAGVEGAWSAQADEDGIGLYALDDPNEWAMITPSSQTKGAAYAAAARAWPKVKAAKTLREASDILREAGAKLHGYCRMD